MVSSDIMKTFMGDLNKQLPRGLKKTMALGAAPLGPDNSMEEHVLCSVSNKLIRSTSA